MIGYSHYLFYSLVLLILNITNVYTNQQQFFKSVIYMLSNKTSQVLIMNFVFCIFIGVMKYLTAFFFGNVREQEKLVILEKLKKRILEIALILIVFRDESLDQDFFIMFVGLLSISTLHWLVIKRSEYLIDESQGSFVAHCKVLIFYMLLNVADIIIISKFLTFKQNHIAMLFGYEFLILFTRQLLPFLKYVINLFEIGTYSHFQSKQMIFYVMEFFFTTAKLVIQLLLMNYIRENFGFPLHLIGESLETLLSLWRTIKNFINSLMLSYKLQKLQNIDEQEMEDQDNTCLICLQEIKQGKRISCGHVFHLSCLQSWIQGNVNQFCPKCKEPIQQLTRKMKQNLSQVKSLIDRVKYLETFQDSESIDDQEIGSVPYGLPRQLASYTTPKMELNRSKLILRNMILISTDEYQHLIQDEKPQAYKKESLTDFSNIQQNYKKQNNLQGNKINIKEENIFKQEKETKHQIKETQKYQDNKLENDIKFVNEIQENKLYLKKQNDLQDFKQELIGHQLNNDQLIQNEENEQMIDIQLERKKSFLEAQLRRSQSKSQTTSDQKINS